MKIRTDFVTNSSSSSYLVINLKGKNGENITVQYLDREYNPGEGNAEALLKANSKADLVKKVILMGAEYIPDEIAENIAEYYCGQLSAVQFIRNIVEIDDGILDFDPEEINWESDAATLLDDLWDALDEQYCFISPEGLYELNQKVIEAEDIDSVSISYKKCSYGEFLLFFESLQFDLEETEDFDFDFESFTIRSVEEEDSQYKETYEKLLHLLKSVNPQEETRPSREELAKRALKSGDVEDLCPEATVEIMFDEACRKPTAKQQ